MIRPLYAAVPVLLAFCAQPVAAAAVPGPEVEDGVLLHQCREYAKLAAGKAADRQAAQACFSFMAGYALGYQNRQNTPVAVMPQQACVHTSDIPKFIADYLKNEVGGPIPMPPSAALMGQMVFDFPCKR